MSRAGLSWEDQEVLLGHRMAYYKPTLEHMEREYLKAVPFLTISDAQQAKRELTKEKEEHERNWKEMRLGVLSLKDENRELKARYLRKEEETETLKVRHDDLERTVGLMAEHLGLTAKLKAHSVQSR
jgi:predicted nuclease with TOPRIM domain